MSKLTIAMIGLVAAIVLALLSPAGTRSVPGPAGIAYAEDDWKAEFGTICAKTEDPGVLLPEELKELVVRCDKLKLRLEKLDETQRKVYLKRLQMCRDLFAFMLESREKK